MAILKLNEGVEDPLGGVFMAGEEVWKLREVLTVAIKLAPLQEKSIESCRLRINLCRKLSKATLEPTVEEAKLLQDCVLEVFGCTKQECSQGRQGNALIVGIISEMLDGSGSDTTAPKKAKARKK